MLQFQNLAGNRVISIKSKEHRKDSNFWVPRCSHSDAEQAST